MTGATEQPQLTIRLLGEPGDLGWVVMAHGEIYARDYGYNTGFEALVARIMADYAASRDPERETAWIAEVDGRRVGCILYVADDAVTAQLRTLLVDPVVRGRGLGRRLVDECIKSARSAGYVRMVLRTGTPLVSAIRIYRAAGFHLIAEETHNDWFGSGNLISQTYELDLTASA